MNVFRWDAVFETGFSRVDQQHQHLVNLTNALGERIADNSFRAEDLDTLVGELAQYAHEHFDDEEQIMRQAAIDTRHLTHHQQEHANFFKDVTLLCDDLRNSGSTSPRQLFEFLNNWLVYHILGSDKDMAHQIQAMQRGLSAEQAFSEFELTTDTANSYLLRAVNNLFDQVSLRNRQLARLNQSLESKVEERTRELRDANQKLEQLATTDTLTGLANRRFALRQLQLLWLEELEPTRALGCLLVDADHFKEVNDTCGHDAGDIVLRELARQLEYSVRTDDLVCRMGGDEFLILCPAVNGDGLLHLAQQVQTHIHSLNVQVPGGCWKGSISVGAAVRTPEMTMPEELIKIADNGVYAAKKAGRNCVRLGSA
ncbi:MAG: bacteriohemerythrin [Desulfuromonadaceae bacterium]|nr:bacteriohemerythrin [Desulfuromonadaceae bacterium]